MPMQDTIKNERDRLLALHHYHILDTPPDSTFDKITALIAQLFNVPIALISLVDTNRIWFKSHYGLDIQEVERIPGLCASAVLYDAPYVITDAITDSRSLANPLVTGAPYIRFYVGVPLKNSDNQNIGVLSIIDFISRTITEQEIHILQTFAQIVIDEIELRLAGSRISELNKELLKTQEELKMKVTLDSLTGLWNRSAIMSLLDKSLALAKREGKPLAVMLADIDFFKNINDSYGHIIGDHVLVEVATRMKAAVRESDSLGRFGGEEFLLVMYPGNIEQAKITVERIRNAVNRTPIKIGDTSDTELCEINVSISAGIYSTEFESSFEAKRLIKFADDALYSSKNNGRNLTTVWSDN